MSDYLLDGKYREATDVFRRLFAVHPDEAEPLTPRTMTTAAPYYERFAG